MGKIHLFALALAFLGASASASASAAGLPAEGSTEVRIGTGVEKMELRGEAKAFKVAVGAKLWVWTRVDDQVGNTISIVFEKGGRSVFTQELQVPRKAYRTYAYRTFRKGDGGAWAAKVRGPEGKELGRAEFTVEVE